MDIHTIVQWPGKLGPYEFTTFHKFSFLQHEQGKGGTWHMFECRVTAYMCIGFQTLTLCRRKALGGIKAYWQPYKDIYTDNLLKLANVSVLGLAKYYLVNILTKIIYKCKVSGPFQGFNTKTHSLCNTKSPYMYTTPIPHSLGVS